MAAYTTPLEDDVTWIADHVQLDANDVKIVHNRKQKYSQHQLIDLREQVVKLKAMKVAMLTYVIQIQALIP